MMNNFSFDVDPGPPQGRLALDGCSVSGLVLQTTQPGRRESFLYRQSSALVTTPGCVLQILPRNPYLSPKAVNTRGLAFTLSEIWEGKIYLENKRGFQGNDRNMIMQNTQYTHEHLSKCNRQPFLDLIQNLKYHRNLYQDILLLPAISMGK